ncbi:DUF2695 domain-containing protein [Glutamicibacter sp. PS]|uniref:DUF2695 domain-containing protein n=1 Tax=Glutamicibacter sp. PS TaxID=3075634 RepID=UPI002845CCDC|nr:DUF2695 domain-containing protein [Glutamicibacter sp. PS]MDR4534320.1 DUF2695 domain-containing protein [Glutamicibacter sp. PS]
MNEPLPVAEHECLYCYLYRMFGAMGCDRTLRLSAYYRDTMAPRAIALERKLAELGGFCDCEVLMNVVSPADELGEDDEDEDGAYKLESWETDDGQKELVCTGVRRGSTRPCENWLIRRGIQWGGGQYR